MDLHLSGSYSDADAAWHHALLLHFGSRGYKWTAIANSFEGSVDRCLDDVNGRHDL